MAIYSYGGKSSKNTWYGKVVPKTSAPKPKANLGEGHPAKNLEQQLADAGAKANKNQNIPWYKDARSRQQYAQEAVKNNNFDAFKEFSDEQIRQMYPDDPQLANYIINGKNGTFMREVKSLNEDAIAYEKKYGKVSDADVDSIIDAAIQKRDKKSLEDMGILTNDAIERWIDRHPSNSGFGKTGNILKSWRDEPAKYIIEREATDINNASKPVETKPETQYAEQAAKEQANKEETPKDRSIFDIVQDEVKAENPKPAETNTASQPAANPEKVVPKKQAAKDMVDSSKPAKKNEQPAWVRTPWRETMYRLGDKTPEINPPEKYESSPNSLWDFPELAMSRNSSFYLNDAYARKLKRDEMARGSRLNLDNPRSDGFGRSPARYNSFSSILGRNEPLIRGLTAAGVLGLGGLGLYGKYALQNNDEELAQTQVPYRMEPEETASIDVPVAPVSEELPVNEDTPQVEPTLEQQYADQSTPAFNTRINNLFDLYQEQEQLARDKAAFEAQLRAQAIWQRVASGNGYTPELREVTPVSSQEESSTKPKVSRNTDSGSAILNASNQRKPKAIPKNKADNKPAKATSQTTSKPEAALAKALLKTQTESRASRGDSGLQQYRYQSLLNSGLRGMTPDEAIRSGLLTPEQVQVLMRGPY